MEVCFSQILRSFPYGPISGFQKIEILKMLSVNFNLIVIPFSLSKITFIPLNNNNCYILPLSEVHDVHLFYRGFLIFVCFEGGGFFE